MNPFASRDMDEDILYQWRWGGALLNNRLFQSLAGWSEKLKPNEIVGILEEERRDAIVLYIHTTSANASLNLNFSTPQEAAEWVKCKNPILLSFVSMTARTANAQDAEFSPTPAS
eukprot:3081720-Rhodomonas_salina.1